MFPLELISTVVLHRLLDIWFKCSWLGGLVLDSHYVYSLLYAKNEIFIPQMTLE